MKNIIVWAIMMGAAGYGGAKLYLHNEVGNAMDLAVLIMSPYANVEYDWVGIDTPSFFSLLELGDLPRMQGEGMPEYFGILMEGLRIPANADYYQTLYELALEAQNVDDASSPVRPRLL